MDTIEMTYDTLQEKYDALQKKCDVLRDSEEIYRIAIGLTTHTVTIVDIPKHALCQIFNEGSWSGVQTTMEDAPESIIKTGIIHPEDQEGYRVFYREIYAGAPKSVCSIRVLSENGHWFWFTMYSQTIFDDAGKPLYAVCFSDDLTSRREAELMYRQFISIITEDAQYSWEVNLTKDSIIRHDTHVSDVIDGDQFDSFTEMNETSLNQIVEEDQPRVRTKFERLNLIQAFYDGKRVVQDSYRYRLPGTHKTIWMESKTYLVMDGSGDICAILTARDIDDDKKQEQKIDFMATYDQLCNVLKRDAFNTFVTRELQRSEDGALIMIDVDDFKNVNDTYGHLFGDQVLIAVANQIKRNFRAEDYVARYGGDEFVVFLKDISNRKVLEVSADSLLRKVQEITMKNGYIPHISAGLAQYDKLDTLDSLYRRADEALYHAKQTGKSCWHIG